MVWVIGFIDHLFTTLGTTSNYSATANLYTLQITAAPDKLLPACCVLTSLFLATASNSGYYSASRAQALPSPNLVQNWLPTIPSTELDRHLFPAPLAALN
jgi:hypothetical protein